MGRVWLSGRLRGRVLAKYVQSAGLDPQYFRRRGERRRGEEDSEMGSGGEGRGCLCLQYTQLLICTYQLV